MVTTRSQTRITSPHFPPAISTSIPSPSPPRRKRPLRRPRRSKYFPDPPPSPRTTSPTLCEKIHRQPRTATFYGLIQELITPNVYHLLLSTTLLNQTRGSQAIPVFWRLIRLYPTEHALSLAPLPLLTSLLRPLGLHRIRAQRLIQMATTMVAIPYREENRFRARAKGCPETPIGVYPGVGRYAIDSWRIFVSGGGARVGLEECAETDGNGDWCGEEGRDGSLRSVGVKTEVAPVGETIGRPVDAGKDEGVETNERGSSDVETGKVTRSQSDRHRPAKADTGNVLDDGIPDWKKVMPLDKELRAYLVWRWAKEGIVWHPETGPQPPLLDPPSSPT